MNEDVIFCFVILHYKTIEDTEKCIQSILALDSCFNARILVLDNGSNNGTGEQLEEKYFGIPNIKISISNVNLGFSKGNNLAYTIAKNSFNPDFMIVCNSDIIFEQKNTLELICQIYNETTFHIMGPDIYIPDICFHANPLEIQPKSIEEIQHEIKKCKKNLENLKKACFYDSLQAEKIKAINLIRKLISREKKAAAAIENVVLQGACYILSKNYIKNQDRIFCPMDSFYFEEYFVYKECSLKGYKIVYDPKIRVIHNESSATKKNLSGQIERKKFKLFNLIKSMKTYCEVYGDES